LLVVALIPVALFSLSKAHNWVARGWGQYRSPAAEGPAEIRVRQIFLGGQSVEARFRELYNYFASGFVRHAVPGFARVQYSGAGSRQGFDMDGLEGFARTAPLLSAWVYGGRERRIGGSAPGSSADAIEMVRAGLLAGTNPHSPSYWGTVQNDDQRIVEAADIARVLWLTRTQIWNHLNELERQPVRAWLKHARNQSTPQTNWLLFPVIIELALASLEGEGERSQLLNDAQARFTAYRRLYLEQGWFFDPPHGVDFYNTWGISYDLAWIHLLAPDFEASFITAALRQSAELTEHLIGPRGIPILGRSVCYRTAVPVPLIAATHLESGAFPAGKALRALDVVWQYFIDHGSLRDGALTQGYFNADLRLLDRYSGSGSCHWGLRSLVLAFMHPPEDAFWQAPEQPLPVESADYRLVFNRLGWIVEGTRSSGEIKITVPRNTEQFTTIEDYDWQMRLQESLTRKPARPGNSEVKYQSRYYSSLAPYPMGR
jgi:hypothetical protein